MRDLGQVHTRMLRDTEDWQAHIIPIHSILIYLYKSIGNMASLLPNFLACTHQVQQTKLHNCNISPDKVCVYRGGRCSGFN